MGGGGAAPRAPRVDASPLCSRSQVRAAAPLPPPVFNPYAPPRPAPPGFCYTALTTPVTLPAGASYYIVSEEPATGDIALEMTNPAAATTHTNRDGADADAGRGLSC